MAPSTAAIPVVMSKVLIIQKLIEPIIEAFSKRAIAAKIETNTSGMAIIFSRLT